MELKHDPEANAIYVRLSSQKIVKTRPARGNSGGAMVDFAADGSVVGVELLGVSSGIDLTGLPEPQILYQLLAQEGFPIKVPKGMAVEPIVINSPRALERQLFLGNLLAPTGVGLDDLSQGARSALDNYARFVLDSGDAPSASWNNPLLEICRLVEAELDQTLIGIDEFRKLESMTLGQKGRFLEGGMKEPVIRKSLASRNLDSEYLLTILPKKLSKLAGIRKVTGAAHGTAVLRNATKKDAEKALAIALTGPEAVIPGLVLRRKKRLSA